LSDRGDRRTLHRRLTAGLCALLLLFQIGCHTFLPMQETVPATGQVVTVVLNDRGRVLVGDKLGESIDRVQGELIAAAETAVDLRVMRTLTMQGSSAAWTGEEVLIPREGIRGFQTRQYSRGRSTALVVGMVVGLAVLGGLLSLVAGGNGKPGGNGGCTVDCNPQ
jgi:hypothetical protein